MRNAHLFRIRPFGERDLNAAANAACRQAYAYFGTACLDFSKRLYPDRLDLHCAQQNYGACRLYERAGFRAIAHRIYEPMGIGDIVYRWTGA